MKDGFLSVPPYTILVVSCFLAFGCSDDDIATGDDDAVDDDVADDDTSAPDCIDVWVTWLQEFDAAQEIEVDWSALTESVSGEPIDATTDITQVIHAFLWLTAEEARQGVCDDSLVQSDMAAYQADACPENWDDETYMIDTSKFDGLSLVVTLMLEDSLGMIAIASVVAGAENTKIRMEDGGAVMP